MFVHQFPLTNGDDWFGNSFEVPNNWLVITGGLNSQIESSTLIHELGHVFGLQHTNRGEFDLPGNQVPPGFICAEDITTGCCCGDLIADTKPAHDAAFRCALIEFCEIPSNWIYDITADQAYATDCQPPSPGEPYAK